MWPVQHRLMTLTRRSLLRASALTTGALVVARPLGVLGQPLGTEDAQGTSRASRLFPGQRLVHADMHNHTIFSDAQPDATAELAYQTMEEGGMDAAALTDHSSLSWAPGGVPSEFPCPPDSTGAVGEGCRSVFGLSNEEWTQTLELAQRFTVTPEQALADPSLREYLGIRGFEWSSPTLGHVNVWFTQEYIDPLHTGGLSTGIQAADLLHEGSAGDPTPLSGLLETLIRESGETLGTAGMAGFQQWLTQPPDTPVIGGGADGIAGFNHPGREAERFGEFAFEPALRDRMVSLELLNRREDYLFRLLEVNRRSAMVECLAKGWRPGILGVSDEHDPIKRKDSDVGKGRSGIWVGDLSAAGIQEGMLQRRFFACRVKGLRIDAAADGVRMGQAFSHPGGRLLVQLDIATGTEHSGRRLNVHVMGAPVDGGLLPEILHEELVTLPTDVVEFHVDVDPERHPWVSLRISEPDLVEGDELGFAPDGRAAGTPFEPLGAAWAYTAPWYLDPEAPPAPPSRRAPLTGPGEGDQAGIPIVTPMVVRRAGASRIETAVALSQGAFAAGLDTVLVADGDDFPDALGAAAAAATLPGPVLLVRTDDLPDVVVSEIRRLAPRRIVIMGGPAAVSTAVESRLADLASVVERAEGPDRYATSAAIARMFFPTSIAEVWVASGETFADALPGGPAVARLGGPLLLTQRDALPDVIADELRRLSPQRIVLLGGTAAVGDDVLAQLQAIAPTQRVAGATRFQTAALVSRRVFPTARNVVVASGDDFADALAAGPAAFVGMGPVLLVERDAIPAATDEELRRLKPQTIAVAGGVAAVGQAVQDALESYDIR
jgi:putative cell wall-binding protein